MVFDIILPGNLPGVVTRIRVAPDPVVELVPKKRISLYPVFSPFLLKTIHTLAVSVLLFQLNYCMSLEINTSYLVF